MPRVDVVVVGAGLAGLSCARDLALAGTDVVVVEARPRTGGRVEGEVLDDGRLVQLGGEVVGSIHLAYQELAAELGLRLVPSYTDIGGVAFYDLRDALHRDSSWLGDAESQLQRLDATLVELARTVDPSTPLATEDAQRLDDLSVAAFAHDEGLTPSALRLLDLKMRYTGLDGARDLSVLGHLRAIASVGGHSPTDYEVWENLKVEGGSSVLVDALAAALAGRIRLASPVVALEVGATCRTVLVGGETIESSAIVCALPAPVLRSLRLDGVSDERVRSLRRQRQVPAVKAVVALDEPVWEVVGCNGQILSERESGGFWVQGGSVLSSLSGPSLVASVEQAEPGVATQRLLAGLERALGPVGSPQVLWRHWASDPFSLGYVAHWAPGDLTAVGPLHGTHEPPFFVAGSDHWASGYMEGAVATGRAAAAAVLGHQGSRPAYRHPR